MKINLSDAQVKVVLAALEAFSRFRINQPKTALEAIFPKQCWDLGWDKIRELVAPLQKTFFPDYPPNSGPGICNPEIGKEPQIAYEIQKQIEQYRALQRSGGWFGSTADFSGADLNPSGEPPPEIEGLREMQYMDFLIPDEHQDAVFILVKSKSYEKLWALINEAMPDLARGESMEVTNKFIDDLGTMQKYFVRVYKPRKKIDGEKF
jgi:hypothetical protein